MILYRKVEGSSIHQGIGWSWDKASKPLIVVKIWKFMIFFRRRSKWIWEANKHQEGFRRTILEFDWVR